MAYKFQGLAQLVDKREGLKEAGEYVDYGASSKTTRVWHHSLTKKTAGGSDAASFAAYHVSLGWPGVAYHFIIEPKNIVKGKDGKDRARIVWAQEIGKKSYHVGNSNKFSLGICIAGDYRSDKLDEPTLRSIKELHGALVADGIGKTDKAHNEMPGYSWKACCVFDYKKAIQGSYVSSTDKSESVPDTYTIQEGDTLYSIASRDGAGGVTVDDLIAVNDVDPLNLRPGTKIKFAKAKGAAASASKPATSKASNTRKSNIKKIQDTLNSRYGLRIGEDGIPGPETNKAIYKGLQKELNTQYKAGLSVDGIPGKKTKAKLPIVRQGAKGNITWLIQAILYIKGYDINGKKTDKDGSGVDGGFGSNTAVGAKDFQGDKGLKRDAIIGTNTWAELLV